MVVAMTLSHEAVSHRASTVEIAPALPIDANAQVSDTINANDPRDATADCVHDRRAARLSVLKRATLTHVPNVSIESICFQLGLRERILWWSGPAA